MQDLDDRIHDNLLMVVKAIRSGSLRDPTHLIVFVRTVARRQISAQIDELVHRRRDTLDWDVGLRVADLRRNPEERAALQQEVELMLGVLNELSAQDRAIPSRGARQLGDPIRYCISEPSDRTTPFPET
jgi:hypothetical protein